MKDITDVRAFLSDAVDQQFGAMTGVKAEFRSDALIIETGEEMPWDRAKVEIRFNSNIKGDKYESYYISYMSGSVDADFASKVSVLIGGASSIGHGLEKMGLPAKK